MGKRCLVALDTDHIKQYVFATDKLKEIRGASSILDHLNRREMPQIARKAFQARQVYANGGSGLFLLEGDQEMGKQFGQQVQAAYREQTKGGASITFAVEDIPDSVADAWNDPIPDTLELLRFRLEQARNQPPDPIALASHPFLHTCDACGSRYAEALDPKEGRDPRGRERRYCAVCMGKRQADEYAKGEDESSKAGLRQIIQERHRTGSVAPNDEHPFIWEKIIGNLPKGYDIPARTTRPEDFDALGGSADGKDYLALICADGNNMGQTMSKLGTLRDIHALAEVIDEAVYAALREAISLHLRVEDGPSPVFPFDILLIGGDDIMIATSASAALDVACTLATTFFNQTRGRGPNGSDCSLSVGVVLAPVKYPFGPLHDLAESTLTFAKKEGAKRQQPRARASSSASRYGDTLLNFITVTGSTSPSFERVYALLHAKDVLARGQSNALYATLRPYTVEAMKDLLEKISQGKATGLSRTKLHQIREAVLRLNLSTSVYDGMAVLRNWRSAQRDFVLREVYPLGKTRPDPAPASGTFPRVTFPWFADGPETYRTALLDYVELYDMIPSQERVR